MRNLIGGLNRRPLNALEAIAEAWQIPVSGTDRNSVPAQLYREMRDVRAGRDCWDRLDSEEQEIVRLLAITERAPDQSMTIGELASLVDRSPNDVRETAVSLFQKGLLAGAGTQEEIPVGEEPRVFLPREIGILFRRIQDEIDAGDISQSSLSSLLELLDDGEVEDAMIAWGSEVVPGLETRAEMTTHVLDEASSGERLEDVIEALSNQARRVWQFVTETANFGPVRYDEIIEHVELTGSSPEEANHRRDVLAEIETALLVWHMYGVDGNRYLFAPHDIGKSRQDDSGDRLSASPQPRQAVAGRARGTHRCAVAWDLLSFVRAVSSISSSPETLERVLVPSLWNGVEDGEPDPNYLPFLETLAVRESLLSAPGDGRRKSELGVAWKEWRGRSFRDQLSHLLWTWSSSSDRIESKGGSSVAVTGAAWPQFRRKIVVMIALLEPGSWYSLNEVAHWIVSRDQDVLGKDARIATARSLSEFEEAEDRYRIAAELVVRETIESVFQWFGFVQFNSEHPDELEIFRTTEALAGFERADPVAEMAAPAGRPLHIHEDLIVDVNEPTPLRVWALSAFASFEQRTPVPQYKISEDSLKRALDGGFRLDDVTRFLVGQSGSELPDVVMKTLEDWSSAYHRVWVYPQIVIDVDDRKENEHIRQLVEEMGLQTDDGDDSWRIEIRGADSVEATMKRVAEALTAAGFHVQDRKR